MIFIRTWGWSGGAKVLGKHPVPRRPTDLDYSRARAYCTCSRCGWGLLGHFFSHLSVLSLRRIDDNTTSFRRHLPAGLDDP